MSSPYHHVEQPAALTHDARPVHGKHALEQRLRQRVLAAVEGQRQVLRVGAVGTGAKTDGGDVGGRVPVSVDLGVEIGLRFIISKILMQMSL